MFRLLRPIFGKTNPNISALDFNDVEDDQKEVAQVSKASKGGVLFEDIPLRDYIKDNPEMRALKPHLKKKPLPKDHRKYTIFRTIFLKDKKTEDARNLGNYLPQPMTGSEKDALIATEKKYASYIDRSRVFVSDEYQVPGFKRVVLMGSVFVAGSGGKYGTAYPNELGYIAIRSDGGLSHGVIKSEDRKSGPLPTVAEALEVLCVGRDGWTVTSGDNDDFNIDLNRHSRKSKSLSTSGLDTVIKSLPYSMDNKSKFKIKHLLRAHAEKKINNARWAICQSLDPDVLRTMRGTGQTMASYAAWLTGEDGEGHNAQKSQFRMDAVKSYPILARQMEDYKSLRSVIDERLPLAPALADFLDTSEAQVKRLQGLTWQRAATTPHDTSRRVDDVLNFPEKAIPSNRTEYRAIPMIAEIAKNLFDENIHKTLERLSQGGSPWRFNERMKGTTGQDISDSVDFLAKKLFVPAALNKVKNEAEERGLVWDYSQPRRTLKQLTADAREQILSRMKIKELFELSDRYHRNLARYEDKLEVVSLTQKWNPLVGEVQLSGGIVARELTSSDLLKRQGRKENHCVGGYAGAVLSGLSDDYEGALKIFSIEKNGEVLSTVEIRTKINVREVTDPNTSLEKSYPYLSSRVHQNRAHGNEDPSKASVAAAQQIVDYVNNMPPEKMHTYDQGLKAVRDEERRNKSRSNYVMSSGYNPWNRQALEAAWDELSPALPRSMRKKGLDDLIASSSIDDLEMDPNIDGKLSNLWDGIDETGRSSSEGFKMDIETPAQEAYDFW